MSQCIRNGNLPASAHAGYLLVLVLVFGSIFFMIVSSFTGYVVTQNRLVNQQLQGQRALDVAEAGLNYYRWHLAHRINQVEDGSLDASPITRVYEDPETGPIGEFTVTIASSTYCGSIANIDVSVEGFTYDEPSLTRTVSARYSRPTVAEFSYVIDDNVWAGADRVIIGPYHGNKGIRMDGENQSLVRSGVSTWQCGPTFGAPECNPTSTQPGVFTTTSNADELRFDFPVNQISFTGFNLSLSDMKDRATSSGTHIPYSNAQGYHVEFNGDGTLTATPVTATRQIWGYNSATKWNLETTVIDALDSSSAITATINPACPLVFVDDRIWLEGEVDQKVSLAAAGNDFEGNPANIILIDDITYNNTDAGLLAIAEHSVLFGLDVPQDEMEVSGIFIAKDGRFGRNHYCHPSFQYCGSQALPSDLRPFSRPDELTINGTVVSSGRVGTKWNSGGTYISGFETRYSSYDRRLADDPPPLTPSRETAIYRFSNWRIDG